MDLLQVLLCTLLLVGNRSKQSVCTSETNNTSSNVIDRRQRYVVSKEQHRLDNLTAICLVKQMLSSGCKLMR